MCKDIERDTLSGSYNWRGLVNPKSDGGGWQARDPEKS